MQKLRIRISIIVKQASVYKNRFETACAHFWKDKIVRPVPEMPGPLWTLQTIQCCQYSMQPIEDRWFTSQMSHEAFVEKVVFEF